MEEYDYEEIYDNSAEIDDVDLLFADGILDSFELPKDLLSLSKYDYNLDSPIIIDKIVELVKYLKGEAVIPLFYNPSFEYYKEVFCKERIQVKDLSDPFKPQLLIYNYLHEPVSITAEFRKLIENTKLDTLCLSEVINSFYKGLGDDQPISFLLSPTPEITSYGLKFLELHKLVIMMNNCNCSRGPEIAKLFKSQFLPDTKHKLVRCEKHYFKFQSSSIHNVIITSDFLYSLTYNIIISREHLLMIKDMCLARFNCLMELSMNKRNSSDFLNWLNAGDLCLKAYGDSSYKIFKLIEPICNSLMSDYGSNIIPQFPKFTEFSDFINNELYDKIRVYPLSRDFFDKTFTGNLDDTLFKYGAFRIFGHPVIDYFEGLEDLYKLTHEEKLIDHEFINTLASDLAFIVLDKKYKEDNIWYVDKSQIKKSDPMYMYIMSNTWPPADKIQKYGNRWNKLPLIRCYDLPEFIDPSELYSDKSHSIQLTALLEHIQFNNNVPIPTKRVLETMLKKENTNWIKFLQEVDEKGFEKDDLVIGLRAKEREMKNKGRFFALMSWKLREYFVVTEYLIKKHFIPLFQGLTMADDLNTVIDKMIQSTSGHDKEDCKRLVTVCNHLDYEKWNNNQRGESNNPVFKVMGQFLGFPNLITRTHEIFENSLIYFVNRPDLMTVRNGTVENKTEKRVCWNGQSGGLEGLRQKGWTITSMLMLLRIPRKRNTLIRTLAQGDNQVVITTYRPRVARTETEKLEIYQEIKDNNEKIMKEVDRSAVRMGLRIKKEECMQSIGYLNYGKIIIINGILYPLLSKRVSRMSALSNDQLPTMANILSTVGSNILTISHFSINIKEVMLRFCWYISFFRRVWEIYSCILGRSIKKDLPKNNVDHKYYIIKTAFCDPSLGGICGISLNRFLIRGFPDGVTEALSFWKLVYENTEHRWLKELCVIFGNPKLNIFQPQHFRKLLEQPDSLNLPGGMTPALLLRDKILEGMENQLSEIKNDMIVRSIQYKRDEEDRVLNWLSSLEPWYPKFQSEFYNSTFLGIVESQLSLFQNARTIRNMMRKKIEIEFNLILITSEIDNIKSVLTKPQCLGSIWRCSNEQADHLRMTGWGNKIYGVTVTHPSEMLGVINLGNHCCDICATMDTPYITVLVPKGFPQNMDQRGQYPSYLGSKTSESTALINPWEKETKIPLIKRASHLRVALGWFVDSDSKIAKSIFNNLESLTGEDWSQGQLESYQRTGTAAHRYGCSRQSSGGYCAQNPIISSHMITTTDTLGEWSAKNYDVMFQSVILYCQFTTFVKYSNITEGFSVHHHFKCQYCPSEIEEKKITSKTDLYLPDVSDIIKSWLPKDIQFAEKNKILNLPTIDFTTLTQWELNYQIGLTTGYLFGSSILSSKEIYDPTALFPLTIKNKINPLNYCKGLVRGLIIVSSIHIVVRKILSNTGSIKMILEGILSTLILKLCSDRSFLSITRDSNLGFYFETFPHKIPGSYPQNSHDLGLICKCALNNMMRDSLRSCYSSRSNLKRRLFIFPETNDPVLISSISIGEAIACELTRSDPPNRKSVGILKGLKELYINSINKNVPVEWITQQQNVYVINSEIRYILKHNPYQQQDKFDVLKWGTEFTSKIDYIIMSGTTQHTKLSLKTIPKIKNPTISSMRSAQLATGTHYKIRSILKTFKPLVKDGICGGDGSGGIGALMIRLYPFCRIIFNSLLDITNDDLKGSKPSTPSAIRAMGIDSERCVNLDSVWQSPSDLSQRTTWDYFLRCKKTFAMKINFIILDMQVVEDDIQNNIDRLFVEYSPRLLQDKCFILYKVYLDRLIKEDNVVNKMWNIYDKVTLVRTELSSSHTSEVYVYAEDLNRKPKNYLPDWDDCKKWLELQFCYRDNDKEFSRAIQFARKDMLIGVPISLTNKIKDEIVSILQILGITSRVSVTIGDIIERNEKYYLECLVFLKVTATYFSLKRNILNHRPSNTEVENCLLLLCGCLLAESILIRKIELNNLVLNIINRYGWIYLDLDSAAWTIEKPFNNGITKTVRIDSRLSIIQHISRCVFRLAINQGEPPLRTEIINRMLKQMVRAWDIESMSKTSGCFPARNISVPSYLVSEDPEVDEACYTSRD
ncbi:polymerase [Sripur virus]|uniref:Replicase n=1 Tax=Sripur virus TaxID=1620897 RepID=A0A0D3R1V0_9RHAB|nr:polymerase [Sripur virus]AJR28581.1 polymerase [Sripur virus]